MIKYGMNLLEAVIATAITTLILISTVNMMSSMIGSDVSFKKEVQVNQTNLNISEKILNDTKFAAYTYPFNTNITIPITSNSSTTLQNGVNAIAVLTPIFDSQGNVSTSSCSPGPQCTNFSGTAFSVIPATTWYGGTSYKNYVLIETMAFNTGTSVRSNQNDPLIISTSTSTPTPPTNWSGGTSYLISNNLVPDDFSQFGTLADLGTSAFAISTSTNCPRSGFETAFIPLNLAMSTSSASTSMAIIYFSSSPSSTSTSYPSPSTSQSYDSYLTDVMFKNCRND